MGYELFQSASASNGGRNEIKIATGAPAGGFNPRPPVMADETQVMRTLTRPSRCFNPRPPVMADETNGGGHRPAASTCFNPRPPVMADETSNAEHTNNSKTFQSASASNGGRNHGEHL